METLTIPANFSASNESVFLNERTFEKSPYRTRDSFLIFLYSVTSILAIVGNTMVTRIIWNPKSKLRNSTNLLVGNLAVSDIIGGLSIPVQWIFCASSVLRMSSLGPIPCAITKSTQVLSFYISSIAMMFIAMERYQVTRVVKD